MTADIESIIDKEFQDRTVYRNRFKKAGSFYKIVSSIL
jgi:hypothetical protein